MNSVRGPSWIYGNKPTSARDYRNKVLATSPANLIGYWPMDELSGTVSYDRSGQANNGAYTAIALGAAGIGDGHTSASLDGSTSIINIYSAALASDFNPAEGTFAVWARVSGSGIWVDATARQHVNLRADANNLIRIRRTTTDNQLEWIYIAGGTSKQVLSTAFAGNVGWIHVAITWSVAGDTLIAYANGAQVGSTQTGLGTWSGALAEANTIIGGFGSTAAAVWGGYLAHAALYNTPLTAGQIASLAAL